MQNRLGKKGKKATNRHIIRIPPKVWTKKDVAKSQPCNKEEVRISLPHLPHGVLGPAKYKRRTILPWYMGIQEDNKTLNAAEAGTYSQPSAAYRDLVPRPASPSGLQNIFGNPPYPFPAAVQVTGLGPISNTLVGRISNGGSMGLSTYGREGRRGL